MSQLGMGVLINALSGDHGIDQKEFDGAIIKDAKLEEDTIRITFEDGRIFELYDDGQSCCESRYVTTDDDVSWLNGKKFKGISEKESKGGEEGKYGECHDTCFVEVMTYEGPITLVTHNEHNGYYGGFWLRIDMIEGQKDG